MRVTNGARYIALEQRKMGHHRSVLRLDWFALRFRRTEKKKSVTRSRNEGLARAGTKSIFVGFGNPGAFLTECACGIPHAPVRSSDLNEPLRVNGA